MLDMDTARLNIQLSSMKVAVLNHLDQVFAEKKAEINAQIEEEIAAFDIKSRIQQEIWQQMREKIEQTVRVAMTRDSGLVRRIEQEARELVKKRFDEAAGGEEG